VCHSSELTLYGVFIVNIVKPRLLTVAGEVAVCEFMNAAMMFINPELTLQSSIVLFVDFCMCNKMAALEVRCWQ